MTPPTRAACYVRVSSDKQAAEGVSLAAQEQKLRAYASLYDLQITGMYVDAAESASTLNRPQLQLALAALGKTADAIVVVKLDRLTRSVADLGVLIKQYFQKYSLLSVSEHIDTRSASGRMIIQILNVISEWEREAIGERTKAALQYKKSRGEVVGKIPYGYRRVGDRVELDTQEQRMLEDMRARRLLGETYYAIGQSVRTRNGTPMDTSAVRRLLNTG